MSSVKLVGYTVPTIEEADSLKDLVVYCARVSNPGNQANKKTADKLFEYLKANQHWSPFEMVHVLMEINTTRDIARQILRHRSFSFQEFSQRYADPTKDLAVYMREARLQDTKNRQNSIETDDVQLQAWWDAQQKFLVGHADRIYKEALKKGIAKEQARAVLPEGMMESRRYVNGTIRSWIHFIELRSGNGTQLEHQQIAIECAKVIAKIFPLADEFIANP